MSPEHKAKIAAGVKAARARLKADPIAYAQFRQRTSDAVRAEWKKDQTERKANISTAKKASSAKMSKAERSEKFGWMNAAHVTPERKRMIWEGSLQKWYATATPEQLHTLYEKRGEAIAAATIKNGEVFDNSLPADHPINAWALHLKFKVDFDSMFEV